MVQRKDLSKIKKTTEEFFEKMNVDAEIKANSIEDETVPIKVTVDKPQVLIGKSGRTLAQVQHLLKLALRKKIKGQFYIDLDINEYKKKKTEYLKELAKDTADEVSLKKEEEELPAMPAYERRIIHMELAERNDVTTQSVGKEPERRVVVKPYT